MSSYYDRKLANEHPCWNTCPAKPQPLKNTTFCLSLSAHLQLRGLKNTHNYTAFSPTYLVIISKWLLLLLHMAPLLPSWIHCPHFLGSYFTPCHPLSDLSYFCPHPILRWWFYHSLKKVETLRILQRLLLPYPAHFCASMPITLITFSFCTTMLLAKHQFVHFSSSSHPFLIFLKYRWPNLGLCTVLNA